MVVLLLLYTLYGITGCLGVCYKSGDGGIGTCDATAYIRQACHVMHLEILDGTGGSTGHALSGSDLILKDLKQDGTPQLNIRLSSSFLGHFVWINYTTEYYKFGIKHDFTKYLKVVSLVLIHISYRPRKKSWFPVMVQTIVYVGRLFFLFKIVCSMHVLC